MADEDQPAWAKRLENKIDAVLMALKQVNFTAEIRGNQLAELMSGRYVKVPNPMRWNHEVCNKVIDQGLDGEKPRYEP